MTLLGKERRRQRNTSAPLLPRHRLLAQLDVLLPLQARRCCRHVDRRACRQKRAVHHAAPTCHVTGTPACFSISRMLVPPSSYDRENPAGSGNGHTAALLHMPGALVLLDA